MNRILRFAVFALPLAIAATPIGAVLLAPSQQSTATSTAITTGPPSSNVFALPREVVLVRLSGHTFAIKLAV